MKGTSSWRIQNLLIRLIRRISTVTIVPIISATRTIRIIPSAGILTVSTIINSGTITIVARSSTGSKKGDIYEDSERSIGS